MLKKIKKPLKQKEEGRMKKTLVVVIWLSWLFLLAASAGAIDMTKKWSISGNGGLWKLMIHDDKSSDVWTIGFLGNLGVRYGFTPNLAVGVSGYYLNTGLSEDTLGDAGFTFSRLKDGFKQQNWLVEAMAYYHFMPEKKVAPYVFGGAGIYIWKWTDKDGDQLLFVSPTSGDTIETKDKQITLVGGIGVEWFPTENLSLNLGGKFHYLSDFISDFEKDDRDFLDLPQGLVELFAGVTYYVGAKKDSDKDGVPDDLDQCMDTPLGCIVDANGCPLDADGDGVCDGLDKCPETPKGAKVDANGCPTDADGDKVYDGIDQCANTPAGVKVDSRGCPLDTDSDGVPDHLDKQAATTKGCTVDKDGVAMDSDGDGVCDGIDKCSGTPAGVEVDAMGCALPSKYIPEPEKPVVLEGVNFESNKARLTPNAMTVLDMVAASLIKRKDVKVEVAGHTDSQGPDAYNLKLSQQRAEVVREYLIGKGVPAENLTAKGYGESKPITSNDTKEGREKNRRVELTRSQ